MKKKTKQTKLIVFIVILAIIFILFLFFFFRAYDYQKEYIINKYHITEIYNKNEKRYTFLIKKNNIVYSYIFENKYNRRRELIKNIEEYETESEECIFPISNKIDFYPLCSQDNEVYSYHLSKNAKFKFNFKNVKNLNETYEKIKVNALDESSFLLFNYRGFYLINDDINKNIELFNNDVYTIDLAYQKDEFLIIPDYEQNHYFNKFLVINMLNGKVKEINFAKEIYYDSIFLGDYKNKVYLIDKKEEKEYTIDLKKGKVEELDFKILENGKFVEKSYKEIVNKKLNFLNKSYINYDLNDGILYKVIGDNKIKISTKKVDKIIKNDNDTIYYLVNESLYMYNPYKGEVLLLSNFEWNFNSTNMIYIFK